MTLTFTAKALFVCLLALWTPVAVRDSAPAQRRSRAAATVVLTETDSGREVEVRRGDVLVVRLNAQLGTGYGWRVARNNARRLRPLGESLESSGGGDKVGGAETQVFRFKAVRRGAATLTLHYKRPWEKAESKTFSVEVRVR